MAQDAEPQHGKKPRIVKFSGSTLKDLKALPQDKQDQIANALIAVQYDAQPDLAVSHLSLQGSLSAIELKIQGSPAYRCVYNTKDPGVIHVLYVGKKTANGTDRKLIETVTSRLKAIEASKKGGRPTETAQGGNRVSKARRGSRGR